MMKSIKYCFATYLFTMVLCLMPVIGAEPPARNPHQGKAWDFSHGPLAISSDNRFLVHEDGTRFLWIGDTAWELFHRLSRSEAETYLEKRRSQGFTVVQAVALAEFDGLTRPTPAGFLPLIDNDPARPDIKEGPDNDYWDDIDFMVDLAAKKGLYIAMLPTWGDKVLKKWGQGPEIFNPENAEKYGFFLGKRYGNSPNIIWVLGGDRPCERDSDYAVWRAMVKGIKAGEKTTEQGVKHLMTYHPMGGNSSSKWFHKDDWLDFNMFQSGHWAKDGANDKMVEHDRNLVPTKPVLDGEPRYEDHPVRGDETHTQWFDDFDVRQAAYWGIFSGAFGHTYGCHDIWMMYDGTNERQCADARTHWKEAVDLPGAWQMLYVRRLLLGENLLKEGWKPCQEVITDENPNGIGYAVACQTNDLSKIFVYLPTGRTVALDLGKLSFNPKTATFFWYNPRTGDKQKLERQTNGVFDPPGDEKRGNDWVLIVDMPKPH